MKRMVTIILITVLLSILGCDSGSNSPTPTITQHTNILSASVMSGAANEILIRINPTGICVVLFDSSWNSVGGLTGNITYPGGYVLLSEAPGAANMYYAPMPTPDGEYIVSINGTINAECTFYLYMSDAPNTPIMSAPGYYSTHNIGDTIDFAWSPVGADCATIGFIIHPGTVNNQVAYFRDITDDGLFSTSFGSSGEWEVTVSRCCLTTQGIFKVAVSDIDSAHGFDTRSFIIN